MNEQSDVGFIIKFPDRMHYNTYADNYFALASTVEQKRGPDYRKNAQKPLPGAKYRRA